MTEEHEPYPESEVPPAMGWGWATTPSSATSTNPTPTASTWNVLNLQAFDNFDNMDGCQKKQDQRESDGQGESESDD